MQVQAKSFHILRFPGTKMFWSVLASLFLFLVSGPSLGEQTSSHTKNETIHPDWVVVVAPTMGLLKNTTRFPIPVGRENDELVFEQREMTDNGWGGGATLMGFYKRFAFTSVFFGFPNVNSAKILGSINHFSFAIPTRLFLEPYIATGLALVNTRADFIDYQETRYDEISGETYKGIAHMDTIAVDNRVIAPYPKLGIKFKVPIQHWYVTPFYSFMFENVRTHTYSSGGKVDLYPAEGPGSEDQGGTPIDTVVIRSFDKNSSKNYFSNLIGTDFFLDFHYFMQLRGKVYYNVDHDLWTVRLIGSMMFTKNMGVTAYFEYTQKVTVTNTYFLIGPAFIFTPAGFMDKMMAKRDAAKRNRK